MLFRSLFLNLDNKLRIYNSYNCESTLYRLLHPDPASEPLWKRVEAAERKLLEYSDLVLYCSEDDLSAFKSLAPRAKFAAHHAPNGTSVLAGQVRHKTNPAIESAVFMGSAHPPNIEAAQKIVREIAPSNPSITFHILGRCLPKGKYPKNIVRHGFVTDSAKQALLQSADLAINPMGTGSGSNIKVLDFFSQGIPVLSSEFGMRGIKAIHEQHCVLADEDDFTNTLQ